MKSNIHKKVTEEDPFDRRYWVHNRAKRNWLKFTKRQNNKKFRRLNNV